MRVTLFEGESSPTVRGQGGTLDLHDDTGVRALKEIGLRILEIRALRRGGSHGDGQEI